MSRGARRSDRKMERRFHLAFPLFVASAGIAVSTLFDDPTLKMASLSVAGFGIFGACRCSGHFRRRSSPAPRQPAALP